MVYAVVRAGGRQEKVEVGTVITVNWTEADDQGRLSLPPVLVVDGKKVAVTAKELAKYRVNAEWVDDLRGPKVRIVKFKSKTGYKKRQGHRQELSRLRVTSIGLA